MPLADFEFKGKRKDHSPLHVRILPRTKRGAVEMECSQDGQLFFLELASADWAQVIAAIQANIEEKANAEG